MKVIKLDGKVINIGEWDYNITTDEATGEKVINNPLPDGAVESDEEVTTTDDGSRIAASDYARLRALEYPPIKDQLDDIYHNGVDAWKSNIEAIKDKYPKPR